jgi:uncharacterized membrane protein YdfJ with MMPL/SSD domain
MYRLDALVSDHQRVVILIWLIVVAIAVPFAMHQSDHLTANGYAVPGSQSAEVENVIKREFPQVSRAGLAVLLWPHTQATVNAFRADIRRVQRAAHGISGIELSDHDVQVALFATGLLEPIVLPIQVNVNEDHAQSIAETLRNRLRLDKSVSDGVEVHLLGESALWAGVNDTSKRELASAEKIGFPILLIVLLTVFGSVSAATLPIALAAIAVIVTGALIYFLSLATQLSLFVTNTAALLGIGVAVDYSLIILARVRQELQAGRDLSTARQIAFATSGRTVIFAGLTVIVSLIGLWVIPNSTLHSMALGAIMVVVVSVVASVTLLPALIGVLGARRVSTGVLMTRIRLSYRRRRTGRPRMTWDRWTRAVTRHPIVSIVAAGSVLLTLCIPALSMRTSTGALQQLGAKNETRIGFEEAAKLAGPGSLGPVNVVIHASTSASRAELRGYVAQLRHIAEHVPHVHELGSTDISSGGSDALFTVIPAVDPEAPAATRLVQGLRSELSTPAPGDGVKVAIGGTSASLLDGEREVATNMWKVIVAVLAMAFVVLMVLLRSLLLPLKAIAMNLVSVGAAYGVLVIVFQWGWFDSLFHYRSPGHVETLIPPLILAVVFGLSMDYEVFLLTRIKERWLVSHDSRSAVAEGLAASAKTISSAAFILVCVFAVFVGTGSPSVKEIGIGASVAIGIDATLIRLVLVPAMMVLLGDWNWWLPQPLERLFSRRSTTSSPEMGPASS